MDSEEAILPEITIQDRERTSETPKLRSDQRSHGGKLQIWKRESGRKVTGMEENPPSRRMSCSTKLQLNFNLWFQKQGVPTLAHDTNLMSSLWRKLNRSGTTKGKNAITQVFYNLEIL